MFKKFLAVTATLLLAVGLSVIAVAAPASAHTPTYTASCDNLTFQASAYETRTGNATPNSVKVVIDGATVLDTKFGGSLAKQTFKYDGTTSHTWSIVIDAVGGTNDTQYDKTFTGVTTPCSYPKRDMAVDCSAVTIHWGSALTNELHVNMRLETAKGEITVNAYIDLNVAGGYKTYGLRINGFDPIPLTEQQVKSGLLVFDYPTYVKKNGYTAWAVKWVQVNEMHFNQDEKGDWIYCNWSTEDAAAEVSITPATCDAGESLVLGTVKNATWGKVDGSYTVVATATTGHVFPAGDGVSKDGTTKTFTGTLAGALDPTRPPCAIPTDAAAAVTITPATCEAGEKLVLGSISNATWGTVVGTYTVVATATSGHLFPAGSGVSADGTTKTFIGTLSGALDPNAPPCATKVEPVEPTVVTVSECGTTGSVTPVAVTGVTYVVVFDDKTGDYTVTATPKAGYYFEGDADQTITFTGNAGAYYACDEKPDATIASGECVYNADATVQDREATITLDNSRSNKAVVFEITGDYTATQKVAAGAIVTVTVTGVPADGGNYTVTAGSSTFELTVPPCEVPAPPTPVQRDVVTEKMTCSTTDGVEVTTTTYTTDYVFDVDTVTWVLGTEVAGTPVITHRAMTADETALYCGVKLATDPSASACSVDATGSPFTSWIYVDYNSKVVYTITNLSTNVVTTATDFYTELAPGDYAVKAVAAPGYVLQPSAEKSWEFTVEDTADCELPTKAIVVPALAWTQMSCTAAGTITLSELEPGTITWTANGQPMAMGTHTVKAAETWVVQAWPVDTVDTALDSAWVDPVTVSFSSAGMPCDLTTLALTGTTNNLQLAGIGALFLLGGLGFWVARRRIAAGR